MRTAFIKALTEIAERDESVVLMTGDLGFGVLEDYRKRLAGQFYNVGVAEQNLAGVGTGLALAGHTVFTYSIGNFPTLRCLEQIRNDACYHGANLKIVTVGGGMAYGALGPSHFAIEDMAILRALPDMAVVAPGDPVEVERLVPQIVEYQGPVYLRLGRAGEDRVQREDAEIVLGRPTVAREGDDVLLLTAGGMLPIALDAAKSLEEDGISAHVVSVHTLRPFDEAAIVELASRFPLVVTCEEHSRIGGLGGAVAETLMEAGVRTAFRRFALPASFPQGIGSQEYLREVNGLDAPALREMVVTALSAIS